MEKELIVKWKIRESETPAILNLLPQLVEKTRNEEGNIFYNIYQSANDANELILHERYANDNALEAHKTSAHYQQIVVEQVVPHLEIREVTFVNKIF